jgi:prepilin-type N-terminal cleavage/methylation domain-containing protein
VKAVLRQRKYQAGFTLIELMIATIIFSLVLIIIIYAFLFISNDYVKGNVEAQTQAAARSVIEQVSEDIQLSNEPVSAVITATSGGNTYYMFCVGNHRYSFQYNKELNGSGADGTSHDLVVDDVTGCTSLSPQQLNNPAATIVGTELLGNHMRLGEFSITPNALVPGQYTINVNVAYGNDSTTQDGPLTYKTNILTTPTSYTYTCPSLNIDANFCAKSILSTVVQERVAGE